MEQLAREGVLADLSSYDRSIYVEDTVVSDNYLVQCRVGGAVIVNTEVLKEKNLPEPTSYEDLLKPEYKGLISMANPKSSGTGYMFYKSLYNAWGEEKALKYFDALTENILQYTSSGSGPVNALLQKEVAVGFGMTSHAVTQINEGAPLKVLFFEEGSPFTMYGQSIVAGKETRESVKEVFDFLVKTYSYELNEKFFPEQMFKDKVFSVENYPENIKYSDMKNNTVEEKEKLLELWKY
jgi:iron(III) transport system substrate-binding protein